MKTQTIQDLTDRYPILKICSLEIEEACNVLIDTFKKGNRLFICGNGGSYCDSLHIVGELMKGFIKTRPLDYDFKNRAYDSLGEEGDYLAKHLQASLPTYALGCQNGLSSAYINDVKPELAYAQELLGLAKSSDVLICISTSGNSKNVYYAALTAKLLGVKVILLTGINTGKICQVSDVIIHAPESETYKIQELHLPIYHYLCIRIEEAFYNE